jgi:two-component system, sensor histidine kinase
VQNTKSDSEVGGIRRLLSALLRLPAVASLDGSGRRGNELWIEIYDTGIGIPVDRVGTIFGKLHQLDPQRERLGLGLGLWIARSTTEVLGHELSVRSTVGWGPRFRLVVPLGMTRKP